MALAVLAVFAFAACAGARQPAHVGSVSSARDEVDRLMAHEMAARKIPGAAVAVIANGAVVKRASYGKASLELEVAATAASLFTLASTTKEFTAVAIMTLVQAGKLALDDSVRMHLPELPASWAPVTIRHCLSHTSGLPDGLAADQVNVIPLAGERDALLALLADRPLVAEPGVRAAYNQTGVMLLGDIIERVSGQSYETYIEDHLLKPAGATGFAWGDSWAVVPGRASLYTALEPTADRSRLQLDEQGRPVTAKTIHALGIKGVADWLVPAGGLNASLDGMIRWQTALWSGKVIKSQSLALMSTPYTLRDGSHGPFGLGLIPQKQYDVDTVSSGGGGAVWITTVPAKQLTVIVLTNLQGSRPNDLVDKLLGIYLR
jgi:D-alanyl-D-alanine carboxypeptidase